MRSTTSLSGCTNVAPAPQEPRNLATIPTRFERAHAAAGGVIARLSMLADRLDPIPTGEASAEKMPSPSGLVPQAHDGHDILSNQMQVMAELLDRIERSVG